jgi:hypothetical protein
MGVGAQSRNWAYTRRTRPRRAGIEREKTMNTLEWITAIGFVVSCLYLYEIHKAIERQNDINQRILEIIVDQVPSRFS